MKKFWILCIASAFLYACGDNNVGNRTYDTKTAIDSPNYPIHQGGSDTTPTSNNNAYNPDSMPQTGTPPKTGDGMINQPVQPLEQ